MKLALSACSGARGTTARRCSRRVAAIHRGSAHVPRSRRALFFDDTGNPAFTLDLYEDGDHTLGATARYTRAVREDPPRPSSNDVPQPRLRRLLLRHRHAVLAAVAPRQNRLLLVASYVFYGWFEPGSVLLVLDDRRLVGGAEDGGRPGARSGISPSSLVVNLGMLGVLQVLQLLRRQRRRVLAVVGLPTSPPHARRSCCRSASRSTRSRRSATRSTSTAASCARGRPARLRAVRRVLPAAGRRPDRARRAPAAAGRAIARVSTSQGARRRCVLMAWGLFKKMVIADNVGVDRRHASSR